MNRIEKVQSCFTRWGIDVLIVDNPVDLFYLTGQELSLGRLVIEKKEATLHVDGRYFEGCKQQASVAVKLLGKEAPSFPGKKIGFDANFTTVASFEKLQGDLISLPMPILEVRAIKEPEEIERLRQAAKLGTQGFEFVVSKLEEGVTEEQLALALEIFWRTHGGERLAFSPHIAFGENSAHPHYHVGKRALKKGDIVLIDIGVVLDHYNSDMTRCVFFGDPDPKLEQIFAIVQEAKDEAFKVCKPGTPLADLDAAARDHITKKGYGEQFVHSLGHGVGLDIHEQPWVRKGAEGVLQEGMVLTIEPGIYVPGVGGVRLEDTIVITKNGFENITALC